MEEPVLNQEQKVGFPFTQHRQSHHVPTERRLGSGGSRQGSLAVSRPSLLGRAGEAVLNLPNFRRESGFGNGSFLLPSNSSATPSPRSSYSSNTTTPVPYASQESLASAAADGAVPIVRMIAFKLLQHPLRCESPRHRPPPHQRYRCCSLDIYPTAVTRRAILRRPWIRPVSALHLAAVKIQRFYRSLIARRRILMIVNAVEREPITRYLRSKLPIVEAEERRRGGDHSYSRTTLQRGSLMINNSNHHPMNSHNSLRNNTNSSSYSSQPLLPSSFSHHDSTLETRSTHIPTKSKGHGKALNRDQLNIILRKSRTPIEASRARIYAMYRMYTVAATVIQRAWLTAIVSISEYVCLFLNIQ